MQIKVEVTDTFGGEADYGWCRRFSIDMPESMSNYSVVRRAKKEIGWAGKRCLTTNYGDSMELRPYGECQVAFITFVN